MDALSPSSSPRALALGGIGHLVVGVSSAEAAADFYGRVLGFAKIGSDALPDCGPHVLLAAPSGQGLALAQIEDRPDLGETGVHQAYQAGPPQRDAIAARLSAEGIAVKTYKEDRPAEDTDNFYFSDPDGNRIQLVVRPGKGGAKGISAIDHAAVQVADILWAEQFYAQELGLGVEHRVGWRTADYVRARRWAAGEEDMAPGTRRLDKRYTVMVNRKVVPRANMQLFFRVGASVHGVYLANKHFQEPPEEQLVGVPRTAFAASRADLDKAAAILASRRRPFLGPVTHGRTAPVEASLYFKDTGGNFLELCTPRPR